MNFKDKKTLITAAGLGLVVVLVLVAVLTGGSNSEETTRVDPVQPPPGGLDNLAPVPAVPAVPESEVSRLTQPGESLVPLGEAFGDLTVVPGSSADSSSGASDEDSSEDTPIPTPAVTTLQSLAAYDAVQQIPGYTEEASPSGPVPPPAAAVRFRLEGHPGHFWLSILDGNSPHYGSIDSSAYNKDHYSLPILNTSCYILITDSINFIVKYVSPTPPQDEAAIEASLNPALVVYAAVDEVTDTRRAGLVKPKPAANPGCVDANSP